MWKLKWVIWFKIYNLAVFSPQIICLIRLCFIYLKHSCKEHWIHLFNVNSINIYQVTTIVLFLVGSNREREKEKERDLQRVNLRIVVFHSRNHISIHVFTIIRVIGKLVDRSDRHLNEARSNCVSQYWIIL